MDRDAVQGHGVRGVQESPQLPSRADGLEEAHVLEIGKRLEQRTARAHTVTGRLLGKRVPDELGEPPVPALQVEQELRVAGRASTSRSRSWSRGANGFASRHLSHRIGSGPTVFRWRTSSRPRQRRMSASTSATPRRSASCRRAKLLPARWATTNVTQSG